METLHLLFNTTPAGGGGFTLTDADGWFDALRPGEFRNRADTPAGEVHYLQIIEPEDLAAVVSRWECEGRPELLIDSDHLSYNSNNTTRAMGWVQELRVEAGVLQCRARWSGEGQAALTNGTYRKCSSSIHTRDEPDQPDDAGTAPDKPRRVRPVRLDSVALTNRPNIPGLRPLSNRAAAAPPLPIPSKPTTTTPKHMEPKDLAALLGLPATATEAEIKAAITLNRNRADTSTADLADADLERFKAIIPDKSKDFYRGQLLANRAQTIQALEAQADAMKAVVPDGAERKADPAPGFAGQRLHNRDKAPAKATPAELLKAPEDQESESTRYQKQQSAIAIVLNRQPGLARAAAFDIAASENPTLFT